MNVWQYVSVFLLAGVKFIFSFPFTAGMGLWTTYFLTLSGGVAGVAVFSYFGNEIGGWISRKTGRKRKSSPFSRRRKTVHFWKKFGLLGVAILLPFISPPVGVGVAIAFREEPKRIIGFFAASLAIWGLLFSVFKEVLIEWIA